MKKINHSIKSLPEVEGNDDAHGFYKFALLGLGKAGWKSDLDQGIIGKSHAYSIMNLEKLNLVVGVDQDPTRILEWKSQFNLPAVISIWDALESYEIDIVIISTPIETLFEYLSSISTKYPSLRIIIEKPVVANTEEAGHLFQVLGTGVKNVLVNLPRLFAKETLELKSIFDLKRLTGVHGSYSGEFINTGLHFVSLLNFFFDNLQLVRLADSTNPVIEIYQNSKFLGNVSRDLSSTKSSFDLDMTFEDVHVSYSDGGEKISIISKIGTTIIESTRPVYQLNVYRFIEDHGFEKAVKISGLEEVAPSIYQMFGIRK